MWRAEPYRVFFPLAVLLGWAGIGQWAALAMGVTEEYRSIFHALVMVQGFGTCLAIGFLFTFIPRRTGAPAPTTVEMIGAIVLPVALVVFAWREQWMQSQTAWIALIVLVASFIARRIVVAPLHVREALPASLVWLPISLGAGVLGSVLTAVGASRGDAGMWLHDIGRGLVLQGMMAGLVCGVAPFLVPVITRGQPPGRATRAAVALQLLLALSFFGSFWVDVHWLRAGTGLRAITTGLALFLGHIQVPPSLPGLNRRVVWLSAPCVPLGFLLAAMFPGLRVAALHVTFIGGFALLGLAVSIHVFLSHAGVLAERRGVLWTLVALIAVAILGRLMMDLDRGRFYLWMGIAAGGFLGATVAWAGVVSSVKVTEGRAALPIRDS